jgi:hypothetical protein
MTLWELMIFFHALCLITGRYFAVHPTGGVQFGAHLLDLLSSQNIRNRKQHRNSVLSFSCTNNKTQGEEYSLALPSSISP